MIYDVMYVLILEKSMIIPALHIKKLLRKRKKTLEIIIFELHEYLLRPVLALLYKCIFIFCLNDYIRVWVWNDDLKSLRLIKI